MPRVCPRLSSTRSFLRNEAQCLTVLARAFLGLELASP